MKKQQFILVFSAFCLFAFLFFFGRTVPDKKDRPSLPQTGGRSAKQVISTNDLLFQAKAKLSPSQSNRLTQLENSVVRGDVKNQQINVDNQLSNFWRDSLSNEYLSAYYAGEAAKLENSEKKLNFAAQILLEDLMAEDDPAMQNWLGTNAKALFQQALTIDPANDSAKIGIGACYMLSNISDNPMQAILSVRAIAEKDPDNLYAQMVLGLGGERSGQYDKAIQRFLIVVKKQPNNVEAVLHLSETYDQKGDKANAIKWYKAAENLVAVPEAKKEIEQRIGALK